MSFHLTFDLCCQDETGLSTGAIDGIDVYWHGVQLLHLTPYWADAPICRGGPSFYPNNAGHFVRIGRRRFRCRSSAPGGNIYWASFEVDREVACEMLNHIGAMPAVDCDEAEESFFQWWQHSPRAPWTPPSLTTALILLGIQILK